MEAPPNKPSHWLLPRNSLLLFCGLLAVLEMVLYQDFIWGDKYFIFKDIGNDSYTQVYPTMVQRLRILSGGHLPQWSFNNGLGENLYPFWFEPVSNTIMYLFFRNDVAAGMIWVQLVQTFLAGVFFYSFLKSLKFYFFVCIIGGLLYAFNSYNVIAGSWFLFEFSAYYVAFAFLLFALEQFISYRRWGWYPIAIAFIGITQPFNIYFAAIVTALYVCIRFADKVVPLKKALQTTGRLLLAGAAGIGLSAVLLLSNLHQMLHSPRGTGEYSISAELKQYPVFKRATTQDLASLVLHLFSGNMEGGGDSYTGFYNYLEAPLIGCGLLVLLLLPQLFYHLSNRQRLTYAAVLLFFAVVFCFPFWRYAIWLFSGNYYRLLSLLYILFALLFSMKALQLLWGGAKLHQKTLLASLGLLAWLLFREVSIVQATPDTPTGVVISFLAVYTILLFFIKKKATFKYYPVVFAGVVCLELIVLTNPVLSNRMILTAADAKRNSGYGYDDVSSRMIQAVNKTDTSFFRTAKDFYSGIATVYSYNEAKVQNFKSSRSYYSYNNIYYVRFLNGIGLVRPHREADSRWISGLVTSPMAMRLCSVKYLLTQKDTLDHYVQQGFAPIRTSAGVTLLQQNNSLPLGFCFDTYITQSNYNKLPIPNRQHCLLQAAAVDDALAVQLKGMQLLITNQVKPLNTPGSIDTCVNLLKEDTLAMQLETDNEIKGSISTNQQKLLFFSIPYDEGWHLYLNGKEQKIYTAFGGLMVASVSKGTYNVQLVFEDPYRSKGFNLSVASALVLLLLYGYERYVKTKSKKQR